MNKKTPIPLAIVDDHPLIIEGLKKMLAKEKRIRVTGTFTNGTALLEFLAVNATGIVLLDINLPDVSGTDLCKEIKRNTTETKILAISSYTERAIIMQILNSGASGYLHKNATEAELLRCIDDTLNNQLTFSDAIKEIMWQPSIADLSTVPYFTRRETEVLKLIAAGKTTAEIAKYLFLSPLTIDTHRRNMMQKLKVNNTPALIKIAMERGWL
ncbi:MAG TPA: response regulator transcription factor [Chitinophaga sp.]|uniref:response regulator transcription factor n=1 Tax=Chitinophaga sp. TaxID=1869181 RepID=UPI002CB1A0D3|nr:response regulator transcription factor [Chitinophaga sp.]HVI48984.1 response regulator transcription factor [Chitinophaga sp.]